MMSPLMCRLIELYGREANLKLLAKDLLPLQGVGPQKCLAFSVDGSRFATGGVVSFLLNDYHLTCTYVCFFFLQITCSD